TALQSAPGSLAYGSGAVWATSPDAGMVSKIDPATDAVVQTIPVNNGPSGVAVAFGDVWVANSLAGEVARATTRIRVGSSRGSLWETDRPGSRSAVDRSG